MIEMKESERNVIMNKKNSDIIGEGNVNTLKQLIKAHSTPMDEGEVREILKKIWSDNGLETTELGQYAIFAESPDRWNADNPTVLICAHMDSPGYIVESIGKDGITLVTLGGVAFEEDSIDLILKTNSGKQTITVTKLEDGYVSIGIPSGVQVGDRACFIPEINMTEEFITAPFLDNRIGCFLLTLLAENSEFMQSEGVNIVLGATAAEEMGAFGAPVLAEQIQPDYVIVLDATYASEKQGITLGGGGVLTLSDNSVILSPEDRNNFAELFDKSGIPYQFEVYNYSGTDAKSFPAAGLLAPVRALLIPTENNHHYNEKAALLDILHILNGVKLLAETRV